MPQQRRHINVPIYLKGCLTEFVFGLPVCPPVQKDTGTAFLISQRRLTGSEETTLAVSCGIYFLYLTLLYKAEM